MFINQLTDPSTATTRPGMCDRALLPIYGAALAPRHESVGTDRLVDTLSDTFAGFAVRGRAVDGIRTTDKAVLMGRRAWGPPI